MVVNIFHVGPWTPTIFLRPGSQPSNANRVYLLCFQRYALLDPRLVLPPVTKVVFVQESLVDPKSEVAEPDRTRIGGDADSTASADPVILAVEVRAVKM